MKNEQLIDVERIRGRLESAHLVIAKFGTDGEKSVAYQSMDDIRTLLEENKRLNKRLETMAEKAAESFETAVESARELEQVKAERDFYKNVRDPHETILSLHTELAAIKYEIAEIAKEAEAGMKGDLERAEAALKRIELLSTNILQSYPPREKGADNET